MPDPATQAIVQDSCERWYLCYEYCRKWTPDFDRRMELRDSLRKTLRETVKEINLQD